MNGRKEHRTIFIQMILYIPDEEQEGMIQKAENRSSSFYINFESRNNSIPKGANQLDFFKKRT